MKSKNLLILTNVNGYSHFHPSGRRIYTYIYIYVGTYAVAFLFSRQRFPKFPLDRGGERIETSERSHFFYLLIFIHGCLKPSSFPSGSARPPFSLFHSLKSLVPLPYRRVLLHSLHSTPLAMFPRRLRCVSLSPRLVSILISRASCTMQSATFHPSVFSLPVFSFSFSGSVL